MPRKAEAILPVRAITSSEIAAAEDMFNGNISSDVIDMGQYAECMLVITTLAGATGTATVTVNSCDDNTPTTTTAVAFRYRRISGSTPGAWTAAAAAGFTTTASANDIYQCVVESNGLSGTDQFVQWVMTESANDPVDGAAQIYLLGARYEGDFGLDTTS
jgi:H+/gluconate symporter-like permease